MPGHSVLDVGDAVAVEVEGRRRLGEADVVEARGQITELKAISSDGIDLCRPSANTLRKSAGAADRFSPVSKSEDIQLASGARRLDGALVSGPRIGIRRRLGRGGWITEGLEPSLHTSVP